jgi:hypothetical protein
MSDLSALDELAAFGGKSVLNSADPQRRRRALAGLSVQLGARPQKRSVGELLAIVLTLSARTRRMALPAVEIDLDVFTPEGHRAVRLACRPRA